MILNHHNREGDLPSAKVMAVVEPLLLPALFSATTTTEKREKGLRSVNSALFTAALTVVVWLSEGESLLCIVTEYCIIGRALKEKVH